MPFLDPGQGLWQKQNSKEKKRERERDWRLIGGGQERIKEGKKEEKEKEIYSLKSKCHLHNFI